MLTNVSFMYPGNISGVLTNQSSKILYMGRIFLYIVQRLVVHIP